MSTKQLSGVQARTRAAILAATASALAANRTATMPEIATAAGVGRTTLHRYFADRETLIYEATLDSIRVLMEAVDEAATDDGPALDAMRRFITAGVSIELATLEWVWWWNNQRLHAELDMRTPIEAENAYYGDLESAQPAPAGQGSR